MISFRAVSDWRTPSNIETPINREFRLPGFEYKAGELFWGNLYLIIVDDPSLIEAIEKGRIVRDGNGHKELSLEDTADHHCYFGFEANTRGMNGFVGRVSKQKPELLLKFARTAKSTGRHLYVPTRNNGSGHEQALVSHSGVRIYVDSKFHGYITTTCKADGIIAPSLPQDPITYIRGKERVAVLRPLNKARDETGRNITLENAVKILYN